MTARNYDWILGVNNAINFKTGNTVYGLTSSFEGLIANVNVVNNTLKVKSANIYIEPEAGELIFSNTITTYGGSANTNVIPYKSPSPNVQVRTAEANISSITRSAYIAEKNAFEQAPLVRLYTVYYPGEWYPPNEAGNPTLDGEGLPWPYSFPFRFAEIRGDYISDLQYRVQHGDDEYLPYPIDSTGIGLDSSGKINEVELSVSNFDNLITTLVEDPFLVGNNISNATSAIVNGELLNNIDPRTVPGNPLYDADIASQRGGTNVAFDYSSTQALGGEWRKLKNDTRDLLGAIVEIKSTFANFLDVWPEYSTVKSIYSNNIELYTTMPYRIGDNVTGNYTSSNATIIAIKGSFVVTNNAEFNEDLVIGEQLYIVNPEADPDSYVKDTFKVDSLSILNETVATFTLTSWLQYFKLQLPKRRYLKNNCPWMYRGAECQYPASGSGSIPGILNKTANGYFDINNQEVFTQEEDVCAHDLKACELRNNGPHFGGFPGTGRTIPR